MHQTLVTAKTDTKPEKTKRVKDDFWTKALTKIEALPTPKDRSARIGQRQYYGVVVRPSSPAIDHLQVGRLRDLSEHIEETDLDSGTVAPLVLSGNRRVSEPTFIVPFLAGGRVAIMSPGRSTRPETIANWLTNILGLVPKGKSLQFRPIVDENALEKLLNSKGAVGVEFHMDAATKIPSGQKLSLLDAVENVREQGPSAGTLYVGWSLGRDGGTSADKALIKELATKIKTGKLARRANVNMLVEDEHGKLRRESHSLFEDKIVSKASWQANPNQQSDTSTVLRAISKAMQDFNDRPDV